MKALFTILIFLLSLNISFAQRNDVMLIPFEENGFWGYMNFKKEIIIEPRFEEAYPTYNFRGRIKEKGKYGFIDQHGKLVIKPKYNYAEDFSYGRAKVRKGKKEYVINTDGKKPRFGSGVCGKHNCLYPFKLHSTLIIKGQNDKYGFAFEKVNRDSSIKAIYLPDTISPRFDSIVALTHQLMYVIKDEKIAFTFEGYFGVGAKSILENMKFDYDELMFFDCEFCSRGKSEIIGYRKDNLWGIIRVYNLPKEVSDAKYLNIISFKRGFGFVEYKPGRFGYIYERGKEFFNY